MQSLLVRSLILLFGAFLVLAGNTPALAQNGTLVGEVRSEGSGSPLSSANVLVTSLRDPLLQVSTASNESGNFRVGDLAPGRYEVRTSLAGYRTDVIDAVEVPAGESVQVFVDLFGAPMTMEKMVVTASRRAERVLDSPAAVHVVDGDEIRDRQVLTLADNLQAQPSVDIVRSGLTQSNVVMRGFNNIFSGATLMLVDNRIARVPSLRYNAWNLIPTSNSDLERIEIVSGPGSALYGPNSANGVVHMMTRSPFGSEGTSVTVAGGDRDVTLGGFRHAGSAGGQVGWKIAGQIYRGDDFEFQDPVELGARQLAIDGGADPATLKIALRDHDAEKASAEGRVDIQLSDDAQLIIAAGANRVNSIELTGLGAVQAKDWATGYGQIRLNWKDLFWQVYQNRSDAGDTYNLRTGLEFKDQSRFTVSQLQHQWALDSRQSFVYGVDALLTRPDTEGTINGRNEEDDDINEYGGYLQSRTDFNEQWSLTAAGRVDHHNHLDDLVFSPRAAIVFGPSAHHKLRATYNRAFSTPTTVNLFLDLITASNLGGLGYDLYAKGVPEGGFTFRRDADGGLDGLYMQMAPGLDPFEQVPDETLLPASAHTLWPAVVGALAAGGVDLSHTLANPPGAEVGSLLRMLNPTTGEFDAVDPSVVRNIDRIRPTITNTFEVGYKGTFGNRLSASVDVHHDRIKDFVGPLRVETPNVFFDPGDTDLAAYLLGQGIPAAQLPTVIGAIASIPVGTVTPENNVDPADLILTYRNFGDVDLTGFDVGLDFALSSLWTVGATYSFVSKDFFEDVAGELDVALNAPQHKAGGLLQYADTASGISAGARVRFVDAFPVESGVYIGEVEDYTLLDLNASWTLPHLSGTVVSAQVLNALDEKHAEFVGVPEVGRVGLLRLTHTF